MKSDFKNIISFWSVILLLAFGWLLWHGNLFIKVKAEINPPNIIINEIMYNPQGTDENREWVEIYNNSANISYVIDSNWRFNDGSNHRLTLISGSSTLPAGSYAVLASDANVFLQEYPNFSGTLFDTVMALNNTSDQLSLSSDSGQNLFSIVNYQNNLGANDNGFSLERIGFNENWQESFIANGTPGQTNSQEQIQEENNNQENQATTTSEIIETQPDNNNNATTTPEVQANINSNENRAFYIYNNNFQDIDYYSKVLINEILPDPLGSDTDSEFIELYNSGDVAIDLNGWQLSDSTAKKFIINYSNTASPVIFPGGYIVIYSKTSKISLNNSGDSVRLFKPDETLLKEIFYGKAKAGKSFSRFGDGWQWTDKLTPNNANELVEVEAANLATVKNIIIANTIASSTKQAIIYDPQQFIGLRINEFLPNPQGSDEEEWIEIYNNASSTINLSGFALDDAEGGSKPYYFDASTTIPGFGYLTLNKDKTKISLNNSSDQVRLLDPYGELFDSVEYAKAPSGQSYNYNHAEEEWFWSDQATPGASNIKTDFQTTGELGNSDELNLVVFNPQEIKDLDKGRQVKVRGVVIAPLSIINSKMVYLAGYDENERIIKYQEAIPVYSSNISLLKDLTNGQLIELSGIVSEASGQKRVNLSKESSVDILDQLDLNNASALVIKDLNEDYLSGLFKISGKVLDKKTGEFYLGDETGEIRVLLKSTGLKSSEIKDGAAAEITGILVLSKGELALQPRTKDDVLFGEVFGASETASTTSEQVFDLTSASRRAQTIKYLIYAIIGSIVVAASLFIKKLYFEKR